MARRLKLSQSFPGSPDYRIPSFPASVMTRREGRAPFFFAVPQPFFAKSKPFICGAAGCRPGPSPWPTSSEEWNLQRSTHILSLPVPDQRDEMPADQTELHHHFSPVHIITAVARLKRWDAGRLDGLASSLESRKLSNCLCPAIEMRWGGRGGSSGCAFQKTRGGEVDQEGVCLKRPVRSP